MSIEKTLGKFYVLALYPSPEGMAFALFEDSLSLIDWGITEKKGEMKSEHCIRFTERLIDRHSPDVIVIEDAEQCGSRRDVRVRALYRSFGTLASVHGIDVARYGRAEVNKAFNAAGALKKQERAQLVAAMLPALSHRIPPLRKPWRSEHPRMPLFEAASLGIAHYFHQNQVQAQ
jgi:Holliday junction resolvasome RuvABC endonuclease subunit